VTNFKSSQNSWKTKTLFYDMCGVAAREKHQPPFTLHEIDITKEGVEYKSLYKIYMAALDEYTFVTETLGSMSHWEKLQKSVWFREGYRQHRGVAAWKEDMRLRDESLARKVLLTAAKEGDVSAAKKLFDMTKKPAEAKRGTFVKEEAKKEAVQRVDEKELWEDTALRLNVVKIYD